jgi:hypothetical protein
MSDAKSIDVRNAGDVAYWTKALDTTHEGLLAAVHAVGPDPAAVIAHLRRGSSSEPTPAGQVPDGG